LAAVTGMQNNWKILEKQQLGRHREWWKYNIQTELKEIMKVWGWVVNAS